MFSGVGCFWVLLSSCLVAVCSFSFLSPAWIVKEPRGGGGGGIGAHGREEEEEEAPASTSANFGLLWHCAESKRQRLQDCYAFGGLGRFGQIPSGSWQTSAVLCAGGCALLALSVLLAVVVLFLPSGQCERRACVLASYIQTAAELFCARISQEVSFAMRRPFLWRSPLAKAAVLEDLGTLRGLRKGSFRASPAGSFSFRFGGQQNGRLVFAGGEIAWNWQGIAWLPPSKEAENRIGPLFFPVKLASCIPSGVGSKSSKITGW
ncbi:hypothetical protein JRQ81_008076 [Phrynocephalus forsythii]|uniref:Uncharacterized protein n=1 Tax=Phrynocephalus forsythii TaxID=171643 RepID=A0A9Q0XD99_9SAUR|nr:hypothetical protein JRQ81_008076 [Phrynocephalus forsythii]